MRFLRLSFVLSLFVAGEVVAQVVNFTLSMNHAAYVIGEPVRLVLKVVNRGVTPVIISDFVAYRDNRLVIEVTGTDKTVLKPIREGKFVPDFSLEKDEGEAFQVMLTDWFYLKSGNYRVKAILYCNGYRYESPIEIFDVVQGIELDQARHYVSLRPSVERVIRLVYWAREGREQAFLCGEDIPTGAICQAVLLGDIVRVKKPSIEKAEGQDGRFFVYRQATRDVLVQTEIMSDMDGLRVIDLKRAIESVSSPMIDTLRKAVEGQPQKAKRK